VIAGDAAITLFQAPDRLADGNLAFELTLLDAPLQPAEVSDQALFLLLPKIARSLATRASLDAPK
jgi:hypothetical protein